MLYTKPIDTVTWTTVEEFCAQGVPEGAYLDYKVDYPNDLAKTIAAMANTFGGVIVIGVDERADSRPQTPVAGVPLLPGLAERVTNIVLTNITPPVFPEVAVCPNQAQSKAVVVIRVPQSPESPHAIQNNTRVYLRTGNRNNPEALATLDQQGWLQTRRSRAVELRERIFQEALKRSELALGIMRRISGMPLLLPGTGATNLVVRIVPVFPGDSICTPPELAVLFRSIRVPDYYGTDHEFPIGPLNADLLQDAAFVQSVTDGEKGPRGYYTELSVFGQFFYRQTLNVVHEGRTVIRASEIFCRVDECLASARKFYAAIGYQGFVTLHTSLYKAHLVPLGQWHPDSVAAPANHCPDESIEHAAAFLVSDWETESRRASLAALKTIGWAYNWEVSDELVDAYYMKERRR